MTNLLICENISLSFGLEPLLENARLQIMQGERVCLIGRNGAGKSSLLKIIDGSLLPDSGSIWRKPGLKIARLAQELPDTNLTLFEFVAEALSHTGKLLAEYHALTMTLQATAKVAELNQLGKLQQQLDICHGWQLEQDINTILTRLNLNPEQTLNSLSGGWQRRAALAKALVINPDLLLLDEPTNHLDIEAIQWLENQLLESHIALVFITHDRTFLQQLATRIVELDRGELTSFTGNYQKFLQHKEEMLHAEAKHHAAFDKKLAQEEKWIRQGIKARRTRNEGRVRALESMRRERAKRREQQGKVDFNINAAAQSGQLVVDAQHISHHFNHVPIIQDFSIRIMRGDRIGLVGPNGCGKTTLLNILLGNMTPTEGTLTLGTHLEIAYFDQKRLGLDLEKTVAENVAVGSDTLTINGKTQHTISYLNDFLFSPERARTPVKALSGGECNRLLLAKLFSQPTNLIMMDEPTNDLDIETLELLEEKLLDYQGTLLLVSHDRTFLNNVITSSLIFEGDGQIIEYVGGYQQPTYSATTKSLKKEIGLKSARVNEKKLSYKETQELLTIPQEIEKLELAQTELQNKLADPEFYKQSQDKIQSIKLELKKQEETLNLMYARWEVLLIKEQKS